MVTQSQFSGGRGLVRVDGRCGNASWLKWESHKVSRTRLSPLMRYVLENAGDRIERGKIVEVYAGLKRRYRGWYAYPCMGRKEAAEYQTRYRRFQPTLTRSLKRLELRGLVRLIRHGKYMKWVELTEQGRAVVCLLRAEGQADPAAGSLTSSTETSEKPRRS